MADSPGILLVVPSLRQFLGWQRLADVQVPRGTLWAILIGSRIGQRRTQRAVSELAGTASQLGTLLGTRMREGDEREMRLLALQTSVERLTRWLVWLTIVLGIIGVAAVAATLWTALK
jgi:hypothetical protein